MSPEELKSEIDSMNVKYDALKKEQTDLEEKWGKNIFRRKYDAIGRKMFKMNKQITGKLLTLEKITIGNFKKPESASI